MAAIPSTAFGERELEEAFIEGMSFLQRYPLESVGGIEKVLQTAYDLAMQRQAFATTPKPNGNGGFGARLRDTVWKGFSSGLESHPEEGDSTEEESEDEPELPAQQPQQGAPSTLTSRFATSVWRGITNRSAMDAPSPSPSPERSPGPSPLPSPLPTSASTPTMPSREAVASAAARGTSMIWGYAEKLKDSDAAATISKVSTNWRVKAFDAWSKRGNEAPPPPTSQSAPEMAPTQDHSRSISLTAIQTSVKPADDKRGSMPIIERSYTPPPKPAFFRPVRDSVFVSSPISRSGEASPVSDTGSAGGHNMRGSLSSFKLPDNIPSRTHSGPRPLLLNSSSLITATPTRSPVSPSADSMWAESVRSQSVARNRESQSSISSLSPSEPFRPRKRDTRSDLESDGGGSRKVPINRNKSPSPMASASRRASSRHSMSPPTPPKTHRRLPTESSAPEDGVPGSWGRADAGPDSPTTAPSPPPPGTPDYATTTISEVRVKQPESQRQRGSVVLSEPQDAPFTPPTAEGKPLARRSATITRVHRESVAEASDSSATEPSARAQTLRRKRFPPRLQSLRTSKVGAAEPVPPLPTHAQTLDVPAGDEHEVEATTPRAQSFEEQAQAQVGAPPSPRSRRTRKISTEGRTRKISNEGRRKVSAEREPKSRRESAAVEGDDEGYNELLSAYESEDA